MEIKVDYRIDDIEKLTEKEKIGYICWKEGFEFVSEFEGAQQGNQANLYQVKKDNDEYILKYYKNGSTGGYDQGYFEGGSFDERAYEKAVQENDDKFKIEKALAVDERLRNNPHIVDVVAADRITFYDGKAKVTEYYSIMKKYQPLSLDKNATPNIRDEGEALRLGVQICDALILLHGCKDLFGKTEYSQAGGAKGILHSDIKYENIYCYKDGDSYKYVLGDFGTAKLKGSNSTQISRVGGTFYTMAPEMAKFNYSIKADLYSLCATIYLLVNEGTVNKAKPEERVKENSYGGLIVVKKDPCVLRRIVRRNYRSYL